MTDFKKSLPSEEVVLFDIPSKEPCRAWSPNAWKVRLALNFKQIQYKTCWVEYPDINPVLSGIGLPPNSLSVSRWPYTVPAIRLPSDDYIMESTAITQSLDSLWPNPSLHLGSPFVERVKTVFKEILPLTDNIYLTVVPNLLLNEASEVYFRNDRKRLLGMDIERYVENRTQQQAFEAAAPFIRKLADMLRENTAGPFLMGKEVSWADFVIVSWMIFWERQGVLDQMIMADSKPLRELYEACGPWMKRDAN